MEFTTEFIREYWIAGVIISILFGLIVYAPFSRFLAKEKGYSAGWWFFLGFFFGIFALLAAVGLPDKATRRMNAQLKNLSRKGDLTGKETNLCTDCWLSGDCEREKRAIKKGEIITDCKGYAPGNK